MFDSVYLELSKPLRNYLYYKCGNNAEAEDLLQDAFLKLWTNCKKVEFPKAKNFLYTVATNMFLNNVRKGKTVLKFQQKAIFETEARSPEEIYREKEFKEILEQTISELPDVQREVFLMNRLDGLKYAEIAERLNISIKTVEKRMSNALKVLRKLHKKI